MNQKIDALLSRLEGVKSTNRGKWLCKCPSHADRSPSLSIKLTDDGKILIHCFAGCGVDEIVGALDLSVSDLMPDRPDNYDRKTKKPAPKHSAYELWPLLIQEATVLALGYDALATGGKLTPNDDQRVQSAFTAVMRLNSEVSR